MILRSFGELAATLGHKIEQQERKEYGAEVTVESKCGAKGLRIFNLLSYRESCKVYGKEGYLILTPEEIAVETGYSVQSVIGVLVNLMRNGFARPTHDGKGVKAA